VTRLNQWFLKAAITRLIGKPIDLNQILGPPSAIQSLVRA